MFSVKESKVMYNNMITPNKNLKYEMLLTDFTDDEREEGEDYDDLEASEEGFVLITFNECSYKMINGFPGENPICVIVDKDDNIIDTCSECSLDNYDGDDLSKSMIEWYDKVTCDSCNYDDAFWYTSKE